MIECRSKVRALIYVIYIQYDSITHRSITPGSITQGFAAVTRCVYLTLFEK